MPGLFRRLLGGNLETTDVSPTTEIRIPWLGWIGLMIQGAFIMTLVWMLGWSIWLYDAIQTQSAYFGYWFRRMWLPWWGDKGGYVLYGMSLIVAASIACLITWYRFFTETGAKYWDARDGLYYPGKKVAPENRQTT